MKTSTLNTINELKENNENDLEWYPTTYKMLDVIYEDLRGSQGSVLDIGCGDCRFKSYLNKKHKQLTNTTYNLIKKYYVIEKSKVFINRFNQDTILVGTDFYSTTLIDKNIDYIFCNPPYSDYQNWVVKILKEGFCNAAYLIIPERWKENKAIQEVLQNKGYKTEILFSGDFLNAERQARAKIDIVKINFKVPSKQNPTKFEKTNPFQSWFEEFFNVKIKQENEPNYNTEYEQERNKKKQFKNNIENALIENKPLTEILIELYQEEQIKLIQNYKNLSSLDNELMTELNISLYSVMEGLQQKIQGLKNKYWRELFSRLDTITDKLTNYSRDLLLSILKENTQIDFTRDNIYAVILWVIKNANKYYDQQLIDLFRNVPFIERNKKENS